MFCQHLEFPAVVGFLDQDYRYGPVSIHIPHEAQLTRFSSLAENSLTIGDRTSALDIRIQSSMIWKIIGSRQVINISHEIPSSWELNYSLDMEILEKCILAVKKPLASSHQWNPDIQLDFEQLIACPDNTTNVTLIISTQNWVSLSDSYYSNS